MPTLGSPPILQLLRLSYLRLRSITVLIPGLSTPQDISNQRSNHPNSDDLHGLGSSIIKYIGGYQPLNPYVHGFYSVINKSEPVNVYSIRPFNAPEGYSEKPLVLNTKT